MEIKWLKNNYPRHGRKIRYVPNGVQLPERGYWIDQTEHPLHFLAVGGLTWKKNLGHTIAVFKEIARQRPECRLFLVGGGKDGSLFPHSFPGEITVVPDVGPGEMAAWYARCPYLISSSRYEGGHSFALLEAMSQGCVVCASAIFSSMEIIRDRRNGVLISGADASSDAAAIMAALGDRELLASMRRRAFSTAFRHRWERQAKRMERSLCQG
jgi:glycosyltransferase involved in cell wall biosynthesis